MKLSLEQELAVAKFRISVEKMSERKAKQMLVKSFEEMMLKENYYKELIKVNWGL